MNLLNPLCTMKTNKLIAAALLPLLFSCAKENIEPTSQPENSGNYLTINVSPSNDAITRATYDDNDGIIWQTGGKAGIFCIYDNYYILEESDTLKKIYPFKDSNNNKESTQASFRFNLKAEHLKCSFKFFYPYHSDVNVTTGDNPYIRIPFSVDIGVDDVIVPHAVKRTVATRLKGFKEPNIYTYSLESI